MPTIPHAFLVVIFIIPSIFARLQNASAHPSPELYPRSNNLTGLQSAKTQSTSTFLTSLCTNAAIFAIEIIVFSLLRLYFKAVYEPRTYVPKDERKRSPPLGNRLFLWPFKIWNANFRTVKLQNGVDSYMYVRFLRMMVLMFLPIWLISWAVLLPIYGINSGSGKTGLDQFTFGNMGTEGQERYWAPLSCAWVFTMWIIFVINTEMRHFIGIRQRYLIDPVHSASAQANTILITGIRHEYLNVPALAHLFSHLPGGVRKVWLNHDLKELPDIYKRRMKACGVLESAETKLIANAVKICAKKEKQRDRDDDASRASGSTFSETLSRTSSVLSSDRERGLTLAESIVPKKDWPSRRLPLGPLPFSLPLLNRKVDSITWARAEINETTRLLERGRAILRNEADTEAGVSVGGLAGKVGLGRRIRRQRNFGGNSSSDSEGVGKRKSWRAAKREREARRAAQKRAEEQDGSTSTDTDTDSDLDAETYPALNSAFVLFNRQIAAHLAVQALVHDTPLAMSKKYIEVAPADVIWGNLALLPAEMQMRTIASYAITAALIVLWSIPVAFIGALSNVSNLCETYSWLSWLCKLPKTVIGLIQGVLPATLLSLLMAILPIVLRLLARFEGIPRRTGLELSLMTRYFIFQVIHSFLIVTLSSGIIAALPGLVEDPTSIPSLLASSLPQASNFFLTYIILQGLTGAGAGYLQIANFLLYYVKLIVLGSTPRSLYNIEYKLQSVMWGTLFPATTLIAVISIAYMVISPIINGLAVATFFLFYQMYKYRFLYQLGQPRATDTGGLYFPLAIQHIFVGIYIQQICLCTLFFLVRDGRNEASAIPQAILMIVLIVLTVFYHIGLTRAYNPLIRALPLALADKSAYRSSSGSSSITPGRTDSRRRRRRADQRRMAAGGTYDPTADDGPADFYHPAAAEPLRPIWLPHDMLRLGLGEAEVRENERAGIPAGCENARMKNDGHVKVYGHPPGGAWRDGDDD